MKKLTESLIPESFCYHIPIGERIGRSRDQDMEFSQPVRTVIQSGFDRQDVKGGEPLFLFS